MGLDFFLIWRGLAIFLTAGNPYSSNGYFYPPAFTLLFAPIGLLPQWVGFIILLTASLALGFLAFGKRFVYWLAFAPVLYVLFVGNVDVLFAALVALIKPTRKGAFIAALITLKPQTAIILLPFVLAGFLRENRGLLFSFLAFTALLWGIPALIAPDLMRLWLTGLTTYGHSFAVSAGLWSLPTTPALIVGLCAALLIINRWSDERLTRTTMILVSPVGQWNGLAALTDCAPISLLSPVSLIALYMSGRTGVAYWWALVPVAAFTWHARLKPVLRLVKQLA